MALQPAARYSSARALVDDIEQWLADEPVTAYPEPLLVRLRRFGRRHRTLAAGAIVLLATTAVALALSTALISREKAKTERVAEEKSRLADDNAHLANQERATREQAELAFHEARDAVDDLFTKVSEDSLLNQPGMQGLRKDLLQKTLDYYQRFLQQRADDPAVKEEFAATLFRAGRIIDELESPEQALSDLRQARDLQSQLWRDSPQNAQRLKALGDIENALGRSLHRSAHLNEALAEYQAGRELRQKLADQAPQDSEYLRGLANSLMNIGLLEQDLGKLDVAADQLRSAQQLRKVQLAVADSFKLRRDLAMGYYNWGNLEIDRHDPETAAYYFDLAIACFEKLLSQDPRDLTVQYLLAVCYRKSADTHSEIHSPDAARLYEMARDHFARLVDRNPEVSEYKVALAGVYMNIGSQQNGAAAIDSFDKSRAILAELIDQWPQDLRFRRDLAVTLRGLGYRQIQAGDRSTGRQNLESSINRLEKLIEEAPDNQEFKDELDTSRKSLKDVDAPPSQNA